MLRRLFPAALLLAAGCASVPQPAQQRAQAPTPVAWPDDSPALQMQVLNRVSWGANRSSFEEIQRLGTPRWLEQQLDPRPAKLAAEIQARIDAMTISQRPMAELAAEFRRKQQALQAAAADDRKMERQALQEELQKLSRETQARMLLRAVHSANQLEEHMTWFWMNHFSVFQFKGPLRAMVADYEERAIRPHALGRFRDLVAATARHPAMLVYLDNARNSAGRLNENYARELMELHTLGVDGGYTQADVEALARVLTGWSLDPQALGAARFYPRRHDYSNKLLLGKAIRGSGADELDQAIELLARHPSTARFVSRKLATFFVSDEPPPALVERLADIFSSTDGNIGEVLRALFASPEFRASLGGKFKDPLHYVVSSLRLVLDGRALPDAQPVMGALARMGEPLYARPTPDGYPLARTDWASAGQLATRFEIARAMAYRVPVRIHDAPLGELSPGTREALAHAASPQEWNLLLLSSPEFMHR